MMGCDIHLFAEIKVNGVWHCHTVLDVRRNYELFNKMAGVRGDGLGVIAAPKGLPDDLSVVTQLYVEHWNEDGHTHSWLNAEEIYLLEEWMEEFGHTFRQFAGLPWTPDNLGYLFGSSYGAWHTYPNDRPDGIEDIRFVFWFDN